LVDFGIAKFYRNLSEHVELKEGRPFIGTRRYASLAAHRGEEIGRKDDLESLGFVLIYLLKGRNIRFLIKKRTPSLVASCRSRKIRQINASFCLETIS
jgi:serine/threonine protein kinase